AGCRSRPCGGKDTRPYNGRGPGATTAVNTGPALLFSTAPFFRQPLRQAFRAIADAGFDAVEVMVTQDPATQEPDRLITLADEFGLSVAAIHAPFLLVTRRVWGTDPVEKIDRAIHLGGEV